MSRSKNKWKTKPKPAPKARSRRARNIVLKRAGGRRNPDRMSVEDSVKAVKGIDLFTRFCIGGMLAILPMMHPEFQSGSFYSAKPLESKEDEDAIVWPTAGGSDKIQ